LSYANGIVVSPDTKTVFVAETFARRIRVYARNPSNSDLSLEKDIDLGTGPDNITIADNGDLWLGAHPNLFKLKDHSLNHSLLAPAQVIKIRDPLGQHPVIENILEDSGELISAASVAAPVADRFFVGSIFQNRALECSSFHHGL
jgi:arylesterase/paraoxonase